MCDVIMEEDGDCQNNGILLNRGEKIAKPKTLNLPTTPSTPPPSPSSATSPSDFGAKAEKLKASSTIKEHTTRLTRKLSNKLSPVKSSKAGSFPSELPKPTESQKCDSDKIAHEFDKSLFQDLALRIENCFKISLELFKIEYRNDIKKLKGELWQGASELLLVCIFCLICAITLTIAETNHNNNIEKSSNANEVNSQCLTREQKDSKKIEVLNDLWEKSQENEKDDWILLSNLAINRVYDEDECEDEPEDNSADWGILNSFVYMLTVTTTIGYGHIFPVTTAGRALTIVYAIIGIPMFLILLTDFGKLFTRILKTLFLFMGRLYKTATCRKVRKHPKVQEQKKKITACVKNAKDWCCGFLCRKKSVPQEDPMSDNNDDDAESEDNFMIDDDFNLPVSLALTILLIYILIGCFIYTIWEDWTYFEAFYFIFISMTTIGFGDYVPIHPAFMMATTVYLVFGLALTAMCINIIQEKLSDTFKQASEKLKESLRHIMAADEAETGEAKMVEVADVHTAGVKDSDKEKDDVNTKKEV